MARRRRGSTELCTPQQPSPPPPYIEVNCKSSCKTRRFAVGTDAEFAVLLINRKLNAGNPLALHIEAVKEGEEPIAFGPNSVLVDYGDGWKLQTFTEADLIVGVINRDDVRSMPVRTPNISPGPVDTSVLTQQAHHISKLVWNNEEDYEFRFRTHKFRIENERVMHYVDCAGLGLVARAQTFLLDPQLLSALIERWRPETHTFHMPCGECTITLQDVEVCLGLRVDGLPMSGFTKRNWREDCEQLLGAAPDNHPPNTARIKLSWLRDNFSNCPEDAPDQVVQYHARAYILLLIGGWLFPDSSGARVHLMFLQLLEDWDVAGQISWGSGLLAYLYRSLCNAALVSCGDVGGCAVLLQCWAYQRFKKLALQYGVDRRGLWPIVNRCLRPSKYKHLEIPENIHGFRRFFDQLKSDEFVWEPYNIAQVPSFCRQGEDIWAARVHLLCFHIVEAYNPDRVVRQFGGFQRIPSVPALYEKDLENLDLRRNKDDSWTVIHRQFHNEWSNRHNAIVPIDGPFGAALDYMAWYLRITRRWICQRNVIVHNQE